MFFQEACARVIGLSRSVGQSGITRARLCVLTERTHNKRVYKDQLWITAFGELADHLVREARRDVLLSLRGAVHQNAYVNSSGVRVEGIDLVLLGFDHIATEPPSLEEEVLIASETSVPF